MLFNGNFEAGWSDESSHQVLIIPESGNFFFSEVGNIHTPPGWITWYYHIEGDLAQPEVRDAWKANDQRRVHEGEKAILFFTFGRRHRGGFLQQVEVEDGATYELSVYAHAWSNHKDKGNPEGFPHPDDPFWSEGAGYDIVSWKPSDVPQEDTGIPQIDAKRNFRFCVGIDPTGGINPAAQTVVWGKERHNYNEYTEPITVRAMAYGQTITVFLRTSTVWEFKHNDAYFDEATLVKIVSPEPESGRGSPRTQYARTYVLMSPTMGVDMVQAAAQATWKEERLTIGGSADDAGIGDLDERYIIACNPGDWPGNLAEFYGIHYPGVHYMEIEADSPVGLVTLLAKDNRHYRVVPGPESLPPPPSPPPPPEPPPTGWMEPISLHVQQPTAKDGYGDLEFVRDVKPAVIKTVFFMEHHRLYKQVSPDTITVYRQFTDHQGQFWEQSDLRQGAREFLYTFLDSLQVNREWVDAVEGLNEIGIACGNPDGIERQVEFECWFAEALKEEGSPAAPCLLAVPVGNPEHAPSGEVELMIPAARKVIEQGGYLNYHGYHRVHNGQVDPPWDEGNWLHFAGRSMASWDPIFNAHDLYPQYILGEAGAFFDAIAGWKHHNVFNGDFNAYGQSLLEMRDHINAWNAEHGGRCRGVTLFTYRNPGDDWKYYNLYGYLSQLTELLIGNSAGDRLTHHKDMAWYYGEK